MNRVEGIIDRIESGESLSLVRVNANGIWLYAIVIDTPATADYLNEGNPVKVLFKETEVIISIGNAHHMSPQNKLSGEIKSIETGKILSRLEILTAVGQITALITSFAVQQLELTVGIPITALIKTNEVMLSE